VSKLNEIAETHRGDVGFSERVMQFDAARTPEASTDAKRILDAFRVDRADIVDKFTKEQAYSRAHEDVLEAVARTFDDGEAGDRTYRALVRAMQMIEDSPHQTYGKLRALWGVGDEGGMFFAADKWLRDQTRMADVVSRYDETGMLGPGRREQMQAIIAQEKKPTIRMGDVFEALDSVTQDEVPRVLDKILSPGQRKMLQDIDHGIDLATRKGPLYVPEQVQRALAGGFMTEGEALSSPMSPRTLMRPPEGEGVTSLGRMLLQHERAEDPEVRGRIADHVRKAADSFQEAMENWASTDPEAPRAIRDSVFRSMERGGEEGAQRAAAGRQVIEDIRPTFTGGEFKRGGLGSIVSDMGEAIRKTPGAGRLIGGGVAVFLGAALLSRARRKKQDHTINDMQGPAFMPGGTPYDEDFPLSTDHLQLPPGYEGQQTGVTYDIRTHGGNYDPSFLSEISDITGAAVTGNIYDAHKPFQSDSSRDQVLRSFQ